MLDIAYGSSPLALSALLPQQRIAVHYYMLHCSLSGVKFAIPTLYISLSDIQQEQTIGRAVEAAMSAIPDNRRRQLGTAYWQLERQRLASLLTEWLAVERQRSAFSVVQREQDITLELATITHQAARGP